MKNTATIILIILNLAALVAGMNIIFDDPLLMGMKSYDSIFRIVSQNYVDPIEPEQLFEGSLQKIREGLDPFTGYIPPRSFQYYEEESQGEFSGIGVEITVRDGLLTVISPIAGSPADAAGLRAGDQVTMIGDIDATTLDPDEAIDLIRGKPGTRVELKIRRPGLREEFSVKIERASIQLTSVDYAGLIDSVGYVRLTKFSLTSLAELLDALNLLKLQGMNGLVLDLRGNPGGFLNIAVSITGLFLPRDVLIVSTGGRSPTENFDLHNFMEGEFQGFPMVVLVDRGSASASEILSGALQDYDRAVIMGDTTFGKGLVQNITPLQDGGAFRLTVSKYYLPSGRIIQRFDEREWSQRITKADRDTSRVYRTEGGREVKGGGGVVPDIIIQEEDMNLLEAALIYGGYYFDFAVEYLKNHRTDLVFPLGDDVLRQFREYVESRGFEIPSLLDESFNEFLAAAENQDATFIESNLIDSIKSRIQFAAQNQWKEHADIILENLSRSIARLAYSTYDRYSKFELRYDPQISRAVALIKDREAYRDIIEDGHSR